MESLNKKDQPRLEKVIISKELAFEKTKHLFKPLGTERVDEFKNITIENESIKITFKYEEVEFSTSSLPKNEDEILDSLIRIDERGLLRFLDFKPDQFYRLENYVLQDKTTGTVLNLRDELGGNVVYINKHGEDPSPSEADYLSKIIKVEIAPTSIAGILTMFHEIGHKKDPLLHPLAPHNTTREYKKTHNADEDRLDKERYAWAYCLKRLKPMLPALGVTKEDLDLYIHQWALGTYSAPISQLSENTKDQ